jgi:membrane-bound lytic murein transglycosylase B
LLPIAPTSRYRGWDYLAEKLISDQIPEALVVQVFGDPRFPAWEAVPFSPSPKETSDLYSGLVTKHRVKSAISFIEKHERYFAAARKRYGVGSPVIASIISIESNLGKHFGKELVINRLARVAAVRQPDNVQWNYERLRPVDPTVTEAGLQARAAYLESTFYPEVVAFFKMIVRDRIDPFSLKGSIGGAFGFSQFLPASFLRYGIDGDTDGSTSLFEAPDAILSVANFLSDKGWSEDLSDQQKRAVLWEYNKSEPYITTILKLSDKIDHKLLK